MIPMSDVRHVPHVHVCIDSTYMVHVCMCMYVMYVMYVDKLCSSMYVCVYYMYYVCMYDVEGMYVHIHTSILSCTCMIGSTRKRTNPYP